MRRSEIHPGGAFPAPPPPRPTLVGSAIGHPRKGSRISDLGREERARACARKDAIMALGGRLGDLDWPSATYTCHVPLEKIVIHPVEEQDFSKTCPLLMEPQGIRGEGQQLEDDGRIQAPACICL